MRVKGISGKRKSAPCREGRHMMRNLGSYFMKMHQQLQPYEGGPGLQE